MFVPWRSLTTTPASRSTFRWWLIVGWLTVQHSVKSQAHTSAAEASCRTIDRRTGSARAERSWTSGSVLRIGSSDGAHARLLDREEAEDATPAALDQRIASPIGG